MSKHTPGPWKVTHLTGKNNQPTVIKGTKGIAEILGYYNGNKWDCEANARLIASAPSHHDLLKAIAEAKITDATNLGQLVALWQASAKAEIAKAEGRE